MLTLKNGMETKVRINLVTKRFPKLNQAKGTVI